MIQTYAEIRQEIADRGLHHVGNTRLGTFAQQAATELYTKELWDFRRTVLTDTTPITLPAGALVKHVRDAATNERYWPITESSAKNELGVATGQGQREYTVEGDTRLDTHPSSETELTVVYFGVAPWVTGGDEPDSEGDTTWIPLAYIDIVVEIGTAKGLRDDNREDEAMVLEAEGGIIERRLNDMRAALLRDQVDEPRYIRPESIW